MRRCAPRRRRCRPGRPPARRNGRLAGGGARAARAAGRPVAATITADVGSPVSFARKVQVGTPLAVLASYVDLLASYNFGGDRVGNSLIVREPVGVVGAITPWNYPLHQVVAKVAAALAAGCTVVLKPSEVAPLAAYELADIFHETGLPAGVFNLVSGTGPVTGAAIAGPSGHRRGVVHRLGGGWPAGGRSGGRHRQAGHPGAGRQVGQRDPAGRRPGHRGEGRGGQGVHQLGTDLQRADQDAGAPGRLRRGGRPRGQERRTLPDRRSARRGHQARAAGLGRAAGPGPRLHRAGPDRGRPDGASAGRRPRPGSTTATSCSPPSSPTCART